MLQTERYQMIEGLLAEHNVMSVADLQHTLGTSRATIYRDLKSLSDMGHIQLIRGGAALPSYPNPIKDDEPYPEKLRRNAAEKTRIAQRACAFVQPGMSVFLDSSTTVFEMCEGLRLIPGIQIITNDLRIAMNLYNAPDISVLVTGGFVRRDYYTLTTHTPSQFLQDLAADICFFACDAISPNHGCMITNSDEIPIKREMLSISSQHILLCDHSKFNRTAFCSFAPISGIHAIISGEELSQNIRQEYKDVSLICV